MDEYTVEFADGYEMTVEALDEEDAKMTAGLRSVLIGEDNHGIAVSARLA